MKASFPNSQKLVNVAAMNDAPHDLPPACSPEDSGNLPEGQNAGAATAIPGAAPGKTLSPEAVRALLEAEARRQAAAVEPLPPEINGQRDGEEPTRYGDWEKKGLAVDF